MSSCKVPSASLYLQTVNPTIPLVARPNTPLLGRHYLLWNSIEKSCTYTVNVVGEGIQAMDFFPLFFLVYYQAQHLALRRLLQLTIFGRNYLLWRGQ